MAKTVLITGASRGIGRSTAISFASKGFQVALNYYVDTAAAEKTAEIVRSFGVFAEVFRADVSNSAAVSAMVQEVVERFGSIDVLVCNAGIAQQRVFQDITDEEWSRMIGVHLSGTFYCCRAVLPQMIQRKEGRIITLSSMWGVTGGSCEVHYSAAKAGIIGLTKALAKEVGPSGITVNCVAPGVVKTDMCADYDEQTLEALRQEAPLGRLGTSQDVADAIEFLASDKAGFITGQVLSPNGGIVI